MSAMARRHRSEQRRLLGLRRPGNYTMADLSVQGMLDARVVEISSAMKVGPVTPATTPKASA